MICLIALIVSGVLGVFSATHRKIFFEACDCVFRRITLRRCNTGLDTRLRAAIVGRLLKRVPALGRHVYKHFEVYSWIFIILMLASVGYTVYGGYNYVVYGNCNGISAGFCVFDALDPGEEGSSAFAPVPCSIDGEPLPVDVPNYDELEIQWFGSGELEVVEIGCYTCEYTRDAEASMRKLREKFSDDIRFGFVILPLPQHDLSLEAAKLASCAAEQGRFWEVHDMLMEHEVTRPKLQEIGEMLNVDQLSACFGDMHDFEDHFEVSRQIGLYGTPTVFIGNESLVGPQSYRIFKNKVYVGLK